MPGQIKIGNMGSDPVGVFFPRGPFYCSRCQKTVDRATRFQLNGKKSLCECGTELTKQGGTQNGRDR